MAHPESPKKNKHLTLEDRKEIESCLGVQMHFKAIGKRLEKDPTTISYEVKKHRVEHRNSFTKLEAPCPKLLKAPFVCNGCPTRHHCKYVCYYYRAERANAEYRALLSDAREGTPLNKEEFYKTDEIITNGLRKGQHIFHIMANSPEIHCSKSTVYRHFQKGYYTASIVELPRAVKFKARKAKHAEYVPAGIKVGRSHDDFLAFMEENSLGHHVELDTVIGRVGGKVIMTVHFTACAFMVGLLMENKTALEAAKKFGDMKDTVRNAGISIAELFPALLADNGGEFANVFAFENNPEGEKEVPLFFCNPMAPSEKPFIEKNHTLFRDIVPSGSSFDDFTQDTVNLIFSHVNSVSRNMFHGKTAYEMFEFMYGEQTASLLNISKIQPEEVIQSPKLLKGVDLAKNL